MRCHNLYVIIKIRIVEEYGERFPLTCHSLCILTQTVKGLVHNYVRNWIDVVKQ